jgi:hypothetical protein
MTKTSDAPWVVMYSVLVVLLMLSWTYIPA